jgi:hypothetical protein
VLVRQLRNEMAGALYHAKVRGDRHEPIFLCDQDRELFLSTLLGETCPKTSIGGCVNIADQSLSQDFGTLEANLSQRIGWSQNTWARRLNCLSVGTVS